VRDAANELAEEIQRAIGVGANAAHAARVSTENSLRGVRVPGMAAGGIVMRPTLAVVGEAGPEPVIPLRNGGMGAAPVLHFHFGNYVGDKAELIREVRSGLAEISRDNPDIFAGRA
jgi:hypothetical protein